MPDFSPASERPLLGELLIHRAGLDEKGLSSALERQRLGGDERLGALLIRLGLISEQSLLAALSDQLRIPLLHEKELPSITPLAAALHARHPIPQALAQRLAFFIWETAEEEDSDNPDEERPPRPLNVAARDVLDSTLIEYLERGPAAGRAYHLHLIAARDLERALAQISRKSGDAEPFADLRKLAEDAPVVELVNGVLARATDTALPTCTSNRKNSASSSVTGSTDNSRRPNIIPASVSTRSSAGSS